MKRTTGLTVTARVRRMSYRLRGVVLPDDEERDLYVAGDRITFEPLAARNWWWMAGGCCQGWWMCTPMLGGGSWTARRWLGLPGLEEGAPADVVAYRADPRRELALLEEPSRVILRGRVIR